MREKVNLTKWLWCTLFALVTAGAASASGIIYVDTRAQGAHDGSSWADAFKYLQDALTAAQTADKPVEIRVAQGIYKPNQGNVPWPEPPRPRRHLREPAPGELAVGASVTPDDPNRSVSFHLVEAVSIRGGFAGLGHEDPNVRDIELYQSILSGDLNGDDADVGDPWDILFEPTRADNSYHVVESASADSTAVLDGFVVTGAVQSGMVILGGAPSISDCLFTRNSSTDGFAEDPRIHGGGALYSTNYAQPTLTRCRFIANWAEGHGGAVYNLSAVPTLVKCSFVANGARHGGGIYSWYEGRATMTDCTFEDNWAQSGGAIYQERSMLELTNCTFSGNYACCGALEAFESTGGAVKLAEQSYATITDCLFTANNATLAGGAISDEGNGAHVTRCIFTANQASYGAAIHILCSAPTIINCTLVGNLAQHGNAIAVPSCWASSRVATVVSCILWDGGDEIYNKGYPVISAVYCNIQGGFTGEGNIDADPGFARPGYWDPGEPSRLPHDPIWVEGDYHLKSRTGRWDPDTGTWVQDAVTSPCLDAGYPRSPIDWEPFPNGGRVNMGVYGGTAHASKSYFGEKACDRILAGDINGDCKIDILDFEIMSRNWLQQDTDLPIPPSPPPPPRRR